MLGLGGDDKIKAFHKAINPTIPPTAPKRKHVRKIIVDSWTYGAINIFKQMQREPLDKNGLCCFKALTVIHKILQEGAPRVLNECYNHLSIIHALQKIWSSALAQDPRIYLPQFTTKNCNNFCKNRLRKTQCRIRLFP